MALSLQQLCALKGQGAALAAVMVHQFLEEHGQAPLGVIAEACGLSASSVRRALAALKRLGVPLPKMKHDHAFMDHGLKGTGAEMSDSGANGGDHASNFGELGGGQADDPIRAELLGHGVLPWCVDILMAGVARGTLERQLEYHRHRLSSGFKFQGHPARYLFKACRNDYVPPEGFYPTAHKAQEGLLPEPQAPAYLPPARPPEGPLELPQKIETLRKMMESPLPRVRTRAPKLAAEWGIDLAELDGVSIGA